MLKFRRTINLISGPWKSALFRTTLFRKVVTTMAAGAPSHEIEFRPTSPRRNKFLLAAVLWTVFFSAVVLYFAFADNANLWADAFPLIALGAIVSIRWLTGSPENQS